MMVLLVELGNQTTLPVVPAKAGTTRRERDE
jgi:hypothetical protein